jgi:hypothetical protein
MLALDKVVAGAKIRGVAGPAAVEVSGRNGVRSR